MINPNWHLLRTNFEIPDEAKKIILAPGQLLLPHTAPYVDWRFIGKTDDECNRLFPMLGIDGIFDNVNVSQISSTVYAPTSIPLHMDVRNTVNVIFKLAGGPNSVTSFYKFKEGKGPPAPYSALDLREYVFGPAGPKDPPGYYSEVEVIDSYSIQMGDAILINTQVPHGVQAFSEEQRIVFTAAFRPINDPSRAAIDKLYYRIADILSTRWG